MGDIVGLQNKKRSARVYCSSLNWEPGRMGDGIYIVYSPQSISYA